MCCRVSFHTCCFTFGSMHSSILMCLSWTLLVALLVGQHGGHGVDALPRLQKRIIRGEVAQQPISWLASIQDAGGVHFCGANLISETVAITAAHCFANVPSMAGLVVRANRLDLRKTTLEEGGVDFTIVQYTPHPRYNQQPWANDIGILRLQATAETRANLARITFPKLDDTNGGVVGTTESSNRRTVTEALKNIVNDVDYTNSFRGMTHTAGWGILEPGSKEYSPQLMRLAMDLTQKDKCKESIQFQMPEEQIVCAVGRNFGDTCRGDSGGPLFAEQPGNNAGERVLVGLVSYGLGCAGREGFLWTRERPAVYTSVFHHQEFIQKALVVEQTVGVPGTTAQPPVSSIPPLPVTIPIIRPAAPLATMPSNGTAIVVSPSVPQQQPLQPPQPQQPQQLPSITLGSLARVDVSGSVGTTNNNSPRVVGVDIFGNAIVGKV